MTASATSDDAAWIQRRKREHEFLATFSDRPAVDWDPDPDSPVNLQLFQDMRRFRREFRRSLNQRRIQQVWEIDETSFVAETQIQVLDTPATYSYQRYDLRLEPDNWLDLLYPGDHGDTISDGMFHTSGMSAVSCALATCAREGFATVAMSDRPYYESWLLMQRFFPDISVSQHIQQFPSGADVLLLDTSSPSWPDLPDRSGDVKVVIIDTSAAATTDPRVHRFISDALGIGATVMLVRSHIKLDGFGLEVSRLGSTVVAAPVGDGSEETVESFAAMLRQARAGFGSAFSLRDLYPWLLDQGFAALAQQRTAHIQRVTSEIRHALVGRGGPSDESHVEEGAHGIFLVVMTGLETTMPELAAQTEEFSRRVARVSQEHGLPVFAAGSFALDGIALIDYVNLHDGRHHLRVGGADLPTRMATEIAAVIHSCLLDPTLGTLDA